MAREITNKKEYLVAKSISTVDEGVINVLLLARAAQWYSYNIHHGGCVPSPSSPSYSY
jgi:hypothetical protein